MEKTEYPEKVYEDKLELFDKLIMALLKAFYYPIITMLLFHFTSPPRSYKILDS